MYTKTYRLKNKDVDYYRRLRTSRMMEMFQEASIAHTEQLGMGREKTLDKGLLWTVVQQYAAVERMPEYDDEILVESWPGKTRHVLFPRYYRITDREGNVLVKGSAMWLLIDQDTRKMVFPDPYGIAIEEEVTGSECELPPLLRKQEYDAAVPFTVGYSVCDLNRHMNNARYYDAAEDLIPLEVHERKLRTVLCEYKAEIPYGLTVRLETKAAGNTWYIAGISDKVHFRMELVYSG